MDSGAFGGCCVVVQQHGGREEAPRSLTLVCPSAFPDSAPPPPARGIPAIKQVLEENGVVDKRADRIASWLGDNRRVDAIFGDDNPTVDDVRRTMSRWLNDSSSARAYLISRNVEIAGWEAFFDVLDDVCKSLRSASAGTWRHVLFV